MSDGERVLIEPAQMCQMHQSLLVHQAGIGPDGPWRSLIVVAQITLFQAAVAFPGTYDRLGGDIAKIGTLGCLACYRPDAFGEIVAANGNLKLIKAIGERWTKEGSNESSNT